MDSFATLEAVLLQLKKELAEGKKLMAGTKRVYTLKKACATSPGLTYQTNVFRLPERLSMTTI